MHYPLHAELAPLPIQNPTFRPTCTDENRNLTDLAFAILERDLKRYRNSLSEDHGDALYALLETYTRMAQGQLQGRYAVGLPTGLGKTSSVIAWATAVHRLGLDDISLAVSASKVEALCELKRDLIRHGIPEEKIGLLHSYWYAPKKLKAGEMIPAGYASEPATDANDSRPFMLVTHNRIRQGDRGLELFNTYRGKPRGLLVWDESLFVSESVGINFWNLRAGIGHYRGAWLESREHQQSIQILEKWQAVIQNAIQRGDTLLTLPAVAEEVLLDLRHRLNHSEAQAPIRQLLEIVQEQLRVFPDDQGGVIHYQISVPAEIRNVVVLDASYPIRQLVQLDRSIHNAERALPEMQRLAPLAALKRYDRVHIHHMRAGGGRDTVSKDFQQEPSSRLICQDILQVIQKLPAEESVLVFVYKRREGEKLDMRDILLRELKKAGIDLQAEVNGRRRINVITWGMETSLNGYAHCRHVILAGVLQRSSVDLAASYCGQADDLGAILSRKDLDAVTASETAHLIYQAASRGNCRTVNEQGQAGKMDLYLIHRRNDIQPLLCQAMPGAVWKPWTGNYSGSKEGETEKAAKKIAEYLQGLPEEVSKISTRRLKNVLALKDVPSTTFTRAVDKALAMEEGWIREGRSLLRLTALFPE